MTSPGAAPDDRDARLARLEAAAALQTNLLADLAAGRPVDPRPVAEATAAALSTLPDGTGADARVVEALRRVHALNGAIASAIDATLRDIGRRLEEVRRASRVASDLAPRPADRPKRDWTA